MYEHAQHIVCLYLLKADTEVVREHTRILSQSGIGKNFYTTETFFNFASLVGFRGIRILQTDNNNNNNGKRRKSSQEMQQEKTFIEFNNFNYLVDLQAIKHSYEDEFQYYSIPLSHQNFQRSHRWKFLTQNTIGSN
jgi:hypothetical protein